MLWNPFAELERIRREFDRLFEELVPREEEKRPFAPVLDVYETDKELVVKAELPVLKKRTWKYP